MDWRKVTYTISFEVCQVVWQNRYFANTTTIFYPVNNKYIEQAKLSVNLHIIVGGNEEDGKRAKSLADSVDIQAVMASEGEYKIG